MEAKVFNDEKHIMRTITLNILPTLTIFEINY